MEMEFNVAVVTVKVALAETDPEVAVMVVDPAPAGVARPLAAPIVATDGLLEVHVRFGGGGGVVESDKVAVAWNATVCCEAAGRVGTNVRIASPGWIAIAVTTGAVTVTVALPAGLLVVPAHAALMEGVATFTAVTSPALLTLASP
jgi:hypothetical protein